MPVYVLPVYVSFSLCAVNNQKYQETRTKIHSLDLFHNDGQIKYSLVLMLISLTSLATTSKFQKNICFKTRAVGLTNIKTKECKSGRHF